MTGKRLLWMCVLLAGAGAAAGLLSLRSSSQPTSSASAAAATWAAGERPAPAFRLHDQNGSAVSLAAYRGKPVLVTFMDPVCPDYCPLEAQVLNDAIAQAPASIVAVNVNLANAAPPALVRAARKWHWSRNWRWAVGTGAQLRPVWQSYGVQVFLTKKEVVHTEATYLVDADGNERALFLWPFKAKSVMQALRDLG